MKKSLKYAIVTIMILLASLLIISCDGGATENSPEVQNATKAFQIGSSNESYDTLKLAVQALKDKSKSGAKAALESYTIRLNCDKTDAGASISGIDAEVKIDFQGHTLTLSDGSEGIVIANIGKTVEIANGTVQMAVGASLKSGTTAVITASTDTILSASVNASNTAADAIATSGGNFNIQGSAQITSRDDKRTIVATDTSVIKVNSSQVILTGGMKLDGNADVDLGDSTLKLTQDIEKGDNCSLCVNRDNVIPQNEDVNVQIIDESIHYHSFSEEWSFDERCHWHESTCCHNLTSDYDAHSWDSGVSQRDSCNSVDNIVYTCFCGATYTRKGVTILEHEYDIELNDEKNQAVLTCIYCGETRTEPVIVINDHIIKYQWVWANHSNGEPKVSIIFLCINPSHTHEEDVGSYPFDTSYLISFEAEIEKEYLTACCQESGQIKITATVNFDCFTLTDVKIIAGGPFGHDLVYHDAKERTCTEDGWDSYVTCTRCDYSTYSARPRSGHYFGQGLRKYEATCTESGHYCKVCSRCGYEEFYSTIPAYGHSFNETILKAPLCLVEGTSHYHCIRCGYEYTANTDALGHLLNYAYLPDPNAYSLLNFHCDRCGAIPQNASAFNTAEFTSNWKCTAINKGSVSGRLDDVPMKWVFASGDIVERTCSFELGYYSSHNSYTNEIDETGSVTVKSIELFQYYSNTSTPCMITISDGTNIICSGYLYMPSNTAVWYNNNADTLSTNYWTSSNSFTQSSGFHKIKYYDKLTITISFEEELTIESVIDAQELWDLLDILSGFIGSLMW